MVIVDMNVGISTPELIRKHLSAELKKDKKMYEMIEGRNIDEDIRNTQAGKSAGVAGWLKMPLYGYAIANHLRRPFYYFSLDSMHTYLPTSSSYSDGWWLRKSSSRNKNVWLQSLEKDLKLFQKKMPSSSVAVDLPIGSQPKRWIASSPEDPVSDNSVHAHIGKSKALGGVVQQRAKDPEAAVLIDPHPEVSPPLVGHENLANADGKTNTYYAPAPGGSFMKDLPPSPIPPTLSTKEGYHHPTSLGGFLNVNRYGPMAYASVSSQSSFPEFPGSFAFDDRLPQ
ncbi:hypothetical protein BY996DRAFT_6499149 [Phakopsora pachyrhizi]|nr:hypothetical protein BY996DRAFT_6499149 [Phakopsora pachyrhizi]